MTTKFKTGLIGFFSIVLAFSTLLAACGTKGSADVFRLNLHSEPPTLDTAQMQDNISGTIANAIFEGLTVMDQEGHAKPGVAEKWDVSDDGLVYTFHIRDDAKWSNGDPVTAYDFEYAYQRVLDPGTSPAPPYAYQLYYLKNASTA